MPQSEEAVVRQFITIAEALGLSDVALAGLCGISPHTARLTRIGRMLPKHARCRRAIVDFVTRNSAAAARGDLRACP